MAKVRFLAAQWRNLLMLNYEVDPDVLKPYLPPYTELDLWQGKALASMVGFMFLDTAVFGVKWPWHVNFEEVNLRFYVRHFDGKEWKRGAVFISEIVPKSMIVLIANNLYKEHYRALPMRHSVDKTSDRTTRFSYEWKLAGRWNQLSANVANDLIPIQPGSPEEFIFEHYWGYNKMADAKTMEYQVEHMPWRVGEVKSCIFDADIEKLYGKPFVPFLSKEPYSAFFAEGSDVNVRIAKKILLDPVLPG